MEKVRDATLSVLENQTLLELGSGKEKLIPAL
jgi:hypothetical protein